METHKEQKFLEPSFIYTLGCRNVFNYDKNHKDHFLETQEYLPVRFLPILFHFGASEASFIDVTENDIENFKRILVSKRQMNMIMILFKIKVSKYLLKVAGTHLDRQLELIY